MKKITILLFLLLSFISFSQDIVMQNGSFSQCSGTLYDSGGEFMNYSSNESFILTICPPSSGDIIQLNFTAFSTQLNKDILTIYDGDSTAAPSLGSFSGGSSNNPGLVQATSANASGCLTIEWTSDDSGITTGWIASISCYTPCQTITGSIDSTTPAYDVATSTVVAEIDEVITFNGSGTFSTSGAGAIYTWDFGDGNTATGETVTHSYPTGGLYIVTLIITDTNPIGCQSPPIRLTAQVGASSPGNPYVDAGDDVVIDCDQTCTDIRATFLEIGETSTYNVTSIPFVPPFPFQGLTNSLNPNIDDAWSTVEDLPFDFCFFNDIETEFQIGSNGVIRFDVDPSDTGAISNGWQFTENLPNNTREALAEANVFTPCHDIDPSIGTAEEIAWEIIGTAPNRVLAVSFYNVPMYQCNSLLATHMAVFYETTNVIDIYIKNSPTCSFNDASTVVGIQNDAGTTAFVPPGRNTSDSPWTASDEAWRFTPAGASIIDFAWLDEGGNVVGTTPSLNVCPTQETTYTARVVYTSCNGDIVTVTDDVTVGIDVPFTVDAGPDQDLCIGDADVVLNGDIGSATASYQWSKNGIDLGGATSAALTVSSPDSGTYTVSVTDQSCTLSDDVIVTYFDVPVANPMSEYLLCEDAVVDGFTEFDLSTKDAEAIGTQTDVVVSYFASQSDADNNTSPLANLYTNISNPQTIFVRIENANIAGCFATSSFDLSVGSGISLGQPDDLTACDDSSNDGFAAFDLSQQESIILNGLTDVTLSYHLSQSDAESNTGAIATNYTNISNPQTIYVRAQSTTNTLCFSTIDFDLNVDTLPTVVPPTSLVSCDATGTGVAQFTLSDATAGILNGQNNVNVSYYETASDAVAATDALSNSYANISNPQTVYVRLENDNTMCFNTTTLQLMVNPLPVANAPTSLEVCDDNQNGIANFDLELKNAEILNGQTGMVVTYHISQEAAENGSGDLSSPYTNTDAYLQTVYVRVEDVASGCFDTTELSLIVLPLPTVSPITDYELCDYNNPADELEIFDLSSKDVEVLNGQSNVTVTYHASQIDADSGVGILSNSFQNTSNPQTIYVRLENTMTNCANTTTFNLMVNPLPVIVSPTDLVVCDDNVPDGFTAIDLTERDSEVTGGNAQYAVSYHISAPDAVSGASPLVSPYTNTSNPQTVHVRVEDTSTGCYDTTTLELVVEQAPVANVPSPLAYCDPDSDGIGEFDLDDAYDDITAGDGTLVVSYHATPEDAETGDGPLSSPYVNTQAYNQTLYARVENSTLATDCATIVALELVVNDTPQIAAPTQLEACDDDADGFAEFDLTAREGEILNGLDPTRYTLSYYAQEADANIPTNPIAAPSTYTNATPNAQQVWVRADDAVNGCSRVIALELVVNPLPVIGNAGALELCDVESPGDSREAFDLELATPGILNGQTGVTVTFHESAGAANAGTGALTGPYTNTSSPQTLYVRAENDTTGCASFTELTLTVFDVPMAGANPPDLILCDGTNPGDMVEQFDLTENEAYITNGEIGATVSYHTSAAGADSGSDPIAVPASYGNTAVQETIYVRLTRDLTGCYSVVDFDIMVSPLPEVTAVTDYILCEDNTDGIGAFDLASRDAEVLNGQDPGLFTVSYHASQGDADQLAGALASPYQNTANPQRIYIAITNNATGCSISTPSFMLEVQEAAEAYAPVAPYTICDLVGDNDGLGQFDLSTRDAEVLGPQDPTNYTVSYYANATDADNGVNPIPTLYENTANPQTVYVRVDNDTPNATGGDGSICYAVAELTLSVDLLPIFDLGDSHTLCVDTNGTEVIGLPVLDTGLSAAGHSFEWYHESALVAGETGPSLEATASGVYSVTVTNTATGCFDTDATEVIESGPPTLVAEVTTAIFSDAHVIEAMATGDGVYEYSLDGGPWQESGTFAGVSPGEHTVTARDVRGCGLVSATLAVVDYPQYFTPNGDGYNDTWNIVGMDDQPSAKIYIFDRYGKLLKQIGTTGPGWNGTFNGELMPSSDYWFTLEYSAPDSGEKREFKAHFTLKR